MKKTNELYEALIKSVNENAEKTELALSKLCCETDDDIAIIYEAERYSLLGGGKRIRPFIVNEVCRAMGGDEKCSMPLACAVEMIHTYSLIHDDLPCMDDDDIRRGKPSNHKAFGYANALLAGDALLTRAFLTVAEADALSEAQRISAIKTLASFAGDGGMIGGQIIDLIGETETLEFDTLLRLHTLKCGALMKASALLGCIAAGIDVDTQRAKDAARYAELLGIAFQVTDDVLDEISDQSVLGKNVGSDAGHNKTTFLTYFSAEEAMDYARKLTADALSVIKGIDNSVDASLLEALAEYLLTRKN